VEEWFYLLFPLGVLAGCLMLPLRSKKQVILLVVITFILGFNAMRYYYSVNFDPQWNLGVRRMVFCRLDSIMYGVLGAWLVFYKEAFWKSMRLPGVVVGSLIGLFSVWHFFTDLNPVKMAYGSLFSNTAFFTVFSVSIACFLPFLSDWRMARGSMFAKAVTHVSVVSYSVYLVHFALVYKGFNLLSFSGTPFLVTLKYILYWVVVLVISTVNYNLFEKPVTRLRERFFKGG
jgi:peptidoglycan/LPS O-acetylase OafA/YrhL